jgi:Tfp pilus assembly protein FimT
MAYTTIDDGSEYFHTILYTGNGSNGRAITNDANAGDFQPDWLWIKSRSSGSLAHRLYDSTRGASKDLRTHGQNADTEESNALASFDSDGFTIGSAADVNTNSATFVAWQWKANGGSRTTFTESGNNPGGGYQANTTAGFSIVDYTGTGGAGTVQHGLGAVPQLIIIKDRSDSSNWLVYTEPSANTHTLFLNRDVAKEDDATLYNDTTPTSSVFSLGAHNDVNENNDNYIAYCFTSVKGYSKISSYEGNGNADGPFVYTGFKPALLITKEIDNTGNWFIMDNKRDIDNDVSQILFPNLSNAETTGTSGQNRFDFLSNGFKIRGNGGAINTNGSTHIYMAFAEHPFVSSKGVPTTAR